MPILPGEVLNKRYRIVSMIAEGAYGVVYRAWDEVANIEVAVKEYLDASVEIQKRFRQEARRLSNLSHPQLPNVLDHFAMEGVGQYLVSEFVAGVDLQSVLNQYGKLPTDLIINWLQAVSEPLTYLHEKEVLHLNIKPANIRLTPTGELFLVNIGLPGIGVRPRTTGYGSPEQQSQLDVGPTADIYSLGATLYVMLTGQIPPNALSRESGLSDLTPAREVNPDCEPYLSLVASRAMSLRPDTRYEHVADFAKALKRPFGTQQSATEPIRRTEPHSIGQPTPPRITPRFRRQIEQRTIWALSALLVLIIGIGIVSVVFNLPTTSEETGQEATATFVSAVVEAATALAPTATPIPVPTEAPTPTPEPFITETGNRMIFVPPGIFRMGTDEGEPNEGPSHLVRMDGYFIDETEVTNAQYAMCVAAGVCTEPARRTATYHPAYYGTEAYDDYPVIFVNWFDAETFCDWRNARLPSEAEWGKGGCV